MKKLLLLLLVITGCSSQNRVVRDSSSLAGEWKFRIDSLDQGVENKWYEEFAGETVKLPGSMAENMKGDERPVTKQLLVSILNYMNSQSFDPDNEVDIRKVKELFENKQL